MNLQVTGQLAGIEARNGGWFAVHIQEQGQNYPKKLSTKKPDLVQLAQQLMGQMVTALYNEAESTNINPNTGMPYTNRYLEALGLAGSMPQPVQQVQQQPVMMTQQQPVQAPMMMQPQQPMQQPVVPQPQPVMMQQPQVRQSDAEREQKIHRQSAAKVAAAFLPLLQPDDQNLASLIRISEQLVQYFDHGVNWNVAPVQQPVQAQAVQQPQQAQYQPPAQQDPGPPEHYVPPADDDIPF